MNKVLDYFILPTDKLFTAEMMQLSRKKKSSLLPQFLLNFFPNSRDFFFILTLSGSMTYMYVLHEHLANGQ